MSFKLSVVQSSMAVSIYEVHGHGAVDISKSNVTSFIPYYPKDKKYLLEEFTHIWYGNRLIVKPPFRGKGLGKSLMQELIKIADKLKYGLHFDVNAYINGSLTEEQLIEFYKKFGFVSVLPTSLFRRPITK